MSGIAPSGLCDDDDGIDALQDAYGAFWKAVDKVGNLLNTGIELGATVNPFTSAEIGINKIGQGKYLEGALFLVPLVGGALGEGGAIADAARGAEENVIYRYAGKGEAEVAGRTGFVPNTTVRGEPKLVFLSPNRYESAAEPEAALQIGQYNPMGATAPPTHVIEVDPASVRYPYGGNVENGTGVEVVTTGSPRVVRVRKLGG